MKARSFTDNYISIKHQFKGEYGDRQATAAFLCLLDTFDNEKEALVSRNMLTKSEENISDFEAQIAECKKILKRRIKLSSAFRDHLMMPLAIRMALSKNPEEYLAGVLKAYETIKPTYFTGSGQRLITAMVIYENTPEELVDYVCERTYKIYEQMKKEHPVLTGQEDMAFAAMIAMDGEDISDVTQEMEACYRILKKKFVVKMSPMQNVSHVLALTDENPQLKTQKFIALHNKFSAGRSSTGLGPLLIVLAVLSILDITVEEAAREVKEVSITLRQIKGFTRKFNSVDVTLLSCALVAMRHLPESCVVIHNVPSGFLKTILRTAIITSLVVNQSALATSSHK